VGLLERAAPLAELVGCLGQVGGAGRLVLVSGEAGAGKTALVDAFCREHLDGSRVLFGRCDDLFAARPLGPLLDIARQTGGPLADALGSGDQGAAFEAFLAELSGPDPVVVVLEDLQWADEATLDLVRFVARRLDTVRSLVVATHRDDFGVDHPLRHTYGSLVGPLVTRLHLAPLSLDAVRRLVGDGPHDPVALHARTGGNPFFVTEVLSQSGALPDTVRAAVLARTAPLSGSARDALDAAAVLGRQVTPELLCQVGDCEAPAIDECVAAGLLVDDGGRQTFRHDLAREAVEQAMTPLRRRQLHSRALEALGDDGDLVQRAHHAIGAGDRAAIPVLAAMAADRCVTLGAHSQAATLYGCALEHRDGMPPEELRRLLDARAHECERVERPEEALAAAQELSTLLTDPKEAATLAEHEGWMGCLYLSAGRLDEGWATLRRALRRLEPLGDSVALARTLGRLAGNHMVIGDWASAVDIADRALDVAERVGAEAEAIYALGIKGSSLGGTGAIDDGLALMASALERAKAAELPGDVSLIASNMSNALYVSGDYRSALPVIDDAVAVAEAHELRVRRSCGLCERAEVLTGLGRWDEAMADATTVLAQPDVAPINEGAARHHLGRLRARRGDPAARDALLQALALLEPIGQAQLSVPVRLSLAEAAWLTGDDDEMAAQVDACLPDVHRLDPGVAASLALWVRRAGTSWPAEVHLPPPGDLALAGDATALAAWWDERGCPYSAADALGDSDDEDDLRAAHERLLALGARPRAQMVARRLRDLGAREVPRGPRPSTRANAAGLTARETEVAQLLTAGLTNAAIADELVLSTKTVDHHVSSVLAKLGVSTRRDVARAAAERGVDLQDGVVAAPT
jgi:ATP/maltotriose-dependent transcriptional regulator MalT